SGKGGRGGADRAVAAADDHQGVATLDGGCAVLRALASLDEFNPRLDAGGRQRGGNLVRDVGVGRSRAAVAVDEYDRRHTALNSSIGRTDPEGRKLVAVGVAEIGAVEGVRAVVAAHPRRTFVAPAELHRLGV